MKIMKGMLGGMALTAIPFVANAEDMSYRYFQVGYAEAEIDLPGSNESLDGFGTRGSFGFAKNYFVFTEFNSVEFNEPGVTVELDQMVLGLGGHYPLSDTIDLVGRAGAAQLDASIDDGEGGTLFDDDVSGYLVAAGLRAQAGDHVELEFGVVHQSYDDDDIGLDLSDTGFEAAARYKFNRNWAAAVEYQAIGDVSNVFAGVRYSFAPK